MKLIEMINLKDALEAIYPLVNGYDLKYRIKRNIGILDLEVKPFDTIKAELLTTEEQDVFNKIKNNESSEEIRKIYQNFDEISKTISEKFKEADELLLKERETYILLDSLKIEELPDQIDKKTMRSLFIILKGSEK